MTSQLFLGLLLSAEVGGLGYWRQRRQRGLPALAALAASGLVGAILVGTLIFGFGGWIWGLVLITFFVSSSLLSRYRRADKETVATKFAKGSRRDWGQVLANGGIGAALAIAFASRSEPVLFATYLGVMATVNADTWATEVGILSRVSPRLVTTGKDVVRGTSGGVTRLGVWASVAGALLIGAVATALTQIVSLLKGTGWSLQAASFSLLALVGGLTGSIVDSLLGATVQGVHYCNDCAKETERPVHHCGQSAQLIRGWAWLNNDIVNLFLRFWAGW